MRYQNELFQPITLIDNEKSNHTKHLFIAFICTLLVIVSYAFFTPQMQPSSTNNITLTIPDITTSIQNADIKIIEPIEESNLLTSKDDSLSPEPPNLGTARTSIQSMQSLSTIWQEHQIKSGESLSAIFAANNLTKLDFYKIIHANDISSQFAEIRTGNSLLIGHDIAGNLSHLIYKKTLFEELKATRIEDGSFTVELLSREIDRRINSATGVIHSSLFIDGKNAGLSDNIIMQLANIFAWDIDIALSLHEGDTFSVIYEDLYIDNTMIGSGKILAAKFISRGKAIKAVRYQNSDGKASYYTSKGDNMRKAFLRTPIDFARISSRFNLKRKHPVLNRIRAHKGVDYAASRGTPIKAAGDGKIIFRGRKGGYGNVIIIQHGRKYSTLYAHMSKFRKGLRNGSRIKQGEIIGYVGSTGLASGPHLHYEFRINGVHRNPLTVALPNASPIQAKYKADFLEMSSPLFKQLEQLSSIHVASTDTVE